MKVAGAIRPAHNYTAVQIDGGPRTPRLLDNKSNKFEQRFAAYADGTLAKVIAGSSLGASSGPRYFTDVCVHLNGTEDLEAVATVLRARRTVDELSSKLVRPTDRAPTLLLSEGERRLGWTRWGWNVPDPDPYLAPFGLELRRWHLPTY